MLGRISNKTIVFSLLIIGFLLPKSTKEAGSVVGSVAENISSAISDLGSVQIRPAFSPEFAPKFKPDIDIPTWDRDIIPDWVPIIGGLSDTRTDDDITGEKVSSVTPPATKPSTAPWYPYLPPSSNDDLTGESPVLY